MVGFIPCDILLFSLLYYNGFEHEKLWETISLFQPIIELLRRSIGYKRQEEIPVAYKGMAIGKHILDIIVEDTIILELKAVEKLAGVHQAQLLSYLKMANKRLGFLINFNTQFPKHGIKRFVL